MSKPIYETTPEGNVRKIKTGQLIEVDTFSVQKGHRGEMIEIVKVGGGIKRLLRFQVDEAAFNFGPPVADKGPAGAKLAKPARTITISVPREEAITLLAILRKVGDILTTKLIEETMTKNG